MIDFCQRICQICGKSVDFKFRATCRDGVGERVEINKELGMKFGKQPSLCRIVNSCSKLLKLLKSIGV